MTVYNTMQYNTIFVYWGLIERKLNIKGYSLSLKLIIHLCTACAWWMCSQLSVWCVQAVPVSGCGVGDCSSVMRWMAVVVVCKTWCDSLTVLLNSSLSAASHSSSNVGRSGGQYPWRRARSITKLIRCRSTPWWDRATRWRRTSDGLLSSLKLIISRKP